MKVFISYCQENGGLSLAEKVSEIIERNERNRCWYFNRDKTPGIDMYEDIRQKVTEWCDLVVFLCTNGSADSLGQRDEINHVRNGGIIIIPICIDHSRCPNILSRDTFTYEDIDSNRFEEKFEGLARRLSLIKNRIRKLDKRLTAKVV